MNGPFWRLWGWPLALGVATAVGLMAALIGDGVLDTLSWACLGGVLAVGLRALLRRRTDTPDAPPR